MNELTASLNEFFKSPLGVILLSVVTAIGASIVSRIRSRTEIQNKIDAGIAESEEKARALAIEREEQNAKNQEAIRQIIGNQISQIGRLDTDLRAVQTKLGKAQDDLNAAARKLNDADVKMSALKEQCELQKRELDTYRENLIAAEETIRNLGTSLLQKEQESKERDKLLEDLQQGQRTTNERLDAVLKERDKLQEQLKERDTAHALELTRRDEMIKQMQERLDKLEKGDTGNLDATKVPDAEPPST